MKKCCEIFFFIFKFYATFFEGFMKTNLEPGPKRVQSGPKTVQRKRDPGPKLVQTGPQTVQAQIHIFENHLLPLCGRQMCARIFLKKI